MYINIHLNCTYTFIFVNIHFHRSMARLSVKEKTIDFQFMVLYCYVDERQLNTILKGTLRMMCS